MDEIEYLTVESDCSTEELMEKDDLSIIEVFATTRSECRPGTVLVANDSSIIEISSFEKSSVLSEDKYDEHLSQNFNRLKRSVSKCDIFYNDSLKKAKTGDKNDFSKFKKMSVEEFNKSDLLLSREYESKRVDDFNLDMDLLAWCHVETAVDLVCFNQICFTVEHFYHMLKRKSKHPFSLNISKNIMNFLISIDEISRTLNM